MAYASQGQYDRATELLQLFEEDSDREDGAQEVAMRFAKLGLYDRALQFADKAGDYFGPIALVGIATEALKRRDKTKALEVLDTGMRQGEIFSLRWHDVDLENGLLNIQAFHTKTLKEQQVAITTRLAIELERLKANAPDDRDGLVFGILDNVKRSFTAARSKAGLNNLRFHDLRHTAATRLVGAHISLSEVGRVLGHTQANTTYRYVNANVETAKRAAAALDTFNAETNEAPTAPELVH